MPNHAIVIDFVSIAQLAREDASTAVGRNEQVKLVNPVFEGVLAAIEAEPSTKEFLTIWTDATVGEGLLYKSIAHDIPRMITFTIDAQSDVATSEQELQAIVDRYRPSVIAVPLSWPDLQTGPGAKRRRMRAVASRVLEICRQEQLATAWDTGFQPVDTPDNTVDTIKMMAWLQDRGLDPNSWILDVPISEPRVMMMIGRAHIDGVRDIKLLFRPVENEIDADIKRALRIDTLAKSKGVGQVYVGAPHFNASLERLMDDELTADEVSTQVAEMLAGLVVKYGREIKTN